MGRCRLDSPVLQQEQLPSCCKYCNESIGFHIMWRIYQLAEELLAFQEVLCFKELVSF